MPVASATPDAVERIQNPAWMNALPARPVGSPVSALPMATPVVPVARPVLPGEATAPAPAPPVSQEAPPMVPARPIGTPYRPPGRVVPVDSIPVAPAVPRETPTPVPTATPTPTPEPTPTPLPDNAIRITPSGTPEDPAQSALARADSFYSRKMYEFAIPEYEAYLAATPPKAPGRDAALFRVAECQRILNHAEAAQGAYERLLAEFAEGEFASSGAYRLGEIYFAKGVYALAAAQFEKASQLTPRDAVRLAADFYLARSLDEMKESARSLLAYDKVLASPVQENPYRDYAQIAVARLAVVTGDKKRAAEVFTVIAKTGATEDLKAEAGVKAAALWQEAGEGKQARQLLEAVARNRQSEKWAAQAQMALVDLDYAAGDYARLAKLADEIDSVPVEAQSKVLLVAANANRQLGRHPRALELYDRLMREFPNSPEVDSARFQRLVSLYETNHPGLAEELNQFLLSTSNPKERNQAMMLKAETLFKAGKYAEAATAYRPLPDSDLPDALKAEANYKLAWCLAQSAQPVDAAQRYSEFLERYPKHAYVTQVTLERGLAHKSAQAYPAALRDFDAIIAMDPPVKEREMALLQKALLLGERKEYDAMAKAFAELLKAYPQTAAAAQANFWIGWSAYESKDYAAALSALTKARDLDAKNYGDRAGLRIILSHYYLEDRDAVAKEIVEHPVANLPGEVYQWLAAKYLEAKEYAKAEKFLEPLAAGTLGPVPPETYLSLAQARLEQKKFEGAVTVVKKYLETARDPASRTKGLMLQAEAEMGLNHFEAATKLVDECLLLQPEGAVNAQARLLAGRVLAASGNSDEAARAFMTIAVLYDDPKITPDALKRAAAAYKKAGNVLEAQNALKELEKRYPDQLQKKDSAQP